MLGRLFPSRINTTLDNSGRTSTEDPSEQGSSPTIPSSPLVQTTDGRTVVRLYVEILGCDHLGPDYAEDGQRVTATYHPYVKIKLGGVNDEGAVEDKTSIDIHKTKPAQQRLNTRDPIFDHEHHNACFCIDGLDVDKLHQGLLFKVKDAAASKGNDVLGWTLVQPESLWGAGMDDSASRMYHDLNHTLEFELVHPTQLCTGLAGMIHLICRPATDKDVEDCRKKRLGYFQPYTPMEQHEGASRDQVMGETHLAIPPLQDVAAEEARTETTNSSGAELL